MSNPVDLSEFVFVPRYNIAAAAGHGAYVDSESYDYCIAFRKDYINQILSSNTEDFSVITVKGNSMEGVLNHGDLILVNHARTEPSDGLYVIQIGSDLFVKQTQRLPNKRLLVKSSNTSYDPFEIDLNDVDADIRIIGKVEWLGRTIA
ncbi:S24 family peptidase [Neisseria musculi]|uniref:Peptidase S24-like family protein n=1 Tax=Neisseria musculi TaxID=1815583 RepID=A0A7H1MBJ2_9NEIS|nr:helix-turn-helix transcriptional regulator [Neisseria musculi]QNT59007.1 peptidase S24-like family protein [Neisseria musculi]